MKNIKDIFFGSEFDKITDSQIKEIKINWSEHEPIITRISRNIEPNFKVTEHNSDTLKLLLMYFTRNPAFITKLKDISGIEGSFKKGIMLIGAVGTGKSLMFRIFKEYTKVILGTNSFQMHTAIDIIDNVNVSGIEYLDKYSHNFNEKKPYPIRCYIDDIAAKNEIIQHYGTKVNVIEQLLSLRYNLQQRYGTLTHASSNKYPNEFRALYDDRIADRMKEMFNIIELKGESFRK